MLIFRFVAPVIIILALTASVALSASKLPRTPSSKPPTRPDSAETRRAKELFTLAGKENRRLHWDQCLAQKAFIRARQLVLGNYFDHHDPKTGKNPAWELMRRCYNYRFAGENLIQGLDTSENIHQTLMNSPSHRENILSPKFQKLGIGCYDYVCVQLFAGGNNGARDRPGRRRVHR